MAAAWPPEVVVGSRVTCRPKAAEKPVEPSSKSWKSWKGPVPVLLRLVSGKAAEPKVMPQE